MRKAHHLIAILFVLGFVVWWQLIHYQKPVKVNSFNECVAARYPIAESHPKQCRDSEGRVFVENIGNELGKESLIFLTKPRPNDVVKSPLVIEGEARGSWFFEASFPVLITDWDGLIIAEGHATAKSNWMTDEFVPFEAKLEFKYPQYKNNGTLILKKDNPSGLSKYDDALEIPIFFGSTR